MMLAAVVSYWLVAALLFAAAVLLFLEILTPSLGILGALAIVAVGLAVVFAWQLNPSAGVGILIGVVVGLPPYIYFAVRLLKNSPLGRRLILRRAADATSDATPQAHDLEALVGKTGAAETLLRPSGKVRVEGRRVDARSEFEMIEAGQAVRVISASGTNVVVRAVEESD